jgi:hypothetical protein
MATCYVFPTRLANGLIAFSSRPLVALASGHFGAFDMDYDPTLPAATIATIRRRMAEAGNLLALVKPLLKKATLTKAEQDLLVSALDETIGVLRKAEKERYESTRQTTSVRLAE